MSLYKILARGLRRFAASESGSMTVFGLFIVLCLAILGAIVIDVSRLQTRTVMMQNTADSSAYTAMMSRSFNSSSVATTTAIANAVGNMPTGFFGNVLGTADVEWGTWNGTTRTFTPLSSSSSAVRVTVRQTRSGGNPFRNLVLPILGINSFDVTRVSVATISGQDCLREGFVSEKRIDIQSNNIFRRGFCIHSNTGVKVSSNGTFEGSAMVNGVLVPGVKVTMPSPGDNLQLPASGYSSNIGLRDAVGENQYPIHLLTQMDRVFDSVRNSPSTSPFVPSYITNRTVLTTTQRNLGSTTLTAGRIYSITCTGNQNIDIANSAVIKNVVLITNCPVKFGNGAAWESSMLLSTNTDPDKAVTGASTARLGAADGCAAGGGSQIMTKGGVSVPSSMTVYGGQIVASGNVQFSAGGDGVRGISIVAGGTISGTSNMEMQSCNGKGMEGNINIPYAQLVQ